MRLTLVKRMMIPLGGGEGFAREELVASFGVGRAGALALRNYPESLRCLPRRPTETFAGDKLVDLATIDIVRDRERVLPRYNDFRRMLRLAPVAGFEELTGGDPATTNDLRRLKADPLFTDDWGPDLCTREGMSWIEEATMPKVIARHLPGSPRWWTT